MEHSVNVNAETASSRVTEQALEDIKRNIHAMKIKLGKNLRYVQLYPNASLIPYQKTEVLTGVVYEVASTTPMKDLLPFLGPLFQHAACYALKCTNIFHKDKLDSVWKQVTGSLQCSPLPILKDVPVCDEDIVNAYRTRNSSEPQKWKSSLGSNYMSQCSLFHTNGNDYELYLAGGHEQLNQFIVDTLKENPTATVSDFCPKTATPDADSHLQNVLDIVKHMQIVNHNNIALQVQDAISGIPLSSSTSTNTGVRVPSLQPGFSTYYNTIFPATGTGTTCLIAQGVYNLIDDMPEIGSSAESVDLFIQEFPTRIRKLTITKDHIGDFTYFPISTGMSMEWNLGMSTEEKNKVQSCLHWTGTLGVHNCSLANFHPYDKQFKRALNTLFGKHGYSTVEKEELLETNYCCVAGMDATTLDMNDYTRFSSHYLPTQMISAPANSAPVRLIFDTFPKVSEITSHHLKLPAIPLAQIIQHDNRNHQYVYFPRSALDFALKAVTVPERTQNIL